MVFGTNPLIDAEVLPHTGVGLFLPMLFWFVATIVTAIACAALYYASAGRMVNETASESGVTNRHFHLVLAGIDADLAAGTLAEAEALAAKGELAREMLRQQGETIVPKSGRWQFGRGASVLTIAAIAVLALGAYAMLGSPDILSQPLAGRADVPTQAIDVDQALTRIEAELAIHPDDLRGWSVIAPVYMKSERYSDAERAYRRVLELGDKTATLQTNLAEALMMQHQGSAEGEAMDLLMAAATSDPADVRSRFYIAGELNRIGDYPSAVEAWTALLSLAKADEPWVTTARQGLEFALSGGSPSEATTSSQSEAIKGMVEGLASRLNTGGGSIQEWTQLLRSYLVLGDKAAAQRAYERAVAAYPKTFDRGDLDETALAGGLILNGIKP